MLTELLPKAYATHRSLPLLGGVLDDFDDWLIQRGYRIFTRECYILRCTAIERYFRRRGPGRYAKVDLEMKRQALARAATIADSIAPVTWRPSRSVLEWLASL